LKECIFTHLDLHTLVLDRLAEMVKSRVKNIITQREFRGEERISLVHNEIPSHLWSQISTHNPKLEAFAAFLRGDVPQVETFPSIGEEEYQELRNLAIKNGWITGTISKGKETISKAKNAKEKIIFENKMRIFKEKLNSFLKNENIIRIRTSLEFRVMSFIRYSWSLLQQKKPNENEIYAVAISILKMPISRAEMITPLREDFLNFRKAFLEKINFDWKIAFSKYPDYLTNPPYLDILPLEPSFSLKANQKKMVDVLVSDKPSIIINRSSLGSGKTAGSVKVAIELFQRDKKKTVIFCCASSAIRLNVAQLAVATGLPFAFYQNGAYLYPPYIAQNIKIDEKIFVNLIIVNYQDVKLLLTRELGNYILILDEPTIGADRKDDPRIHLMTELLFEHSPDQTVIISGTLPAYDDFREFYDRIRIKADEPKTQVIEITDKGSSLGCDMIRPDDTYYVPENLAKNEAMLNSVLTELRSNPLLTRFHNFRRLLSLMEIIDNDDEIEEMTDFDPYFQNPNNWTQIAAIAAVRQILEEIPSVSIPAVCAREPIPVDRKVNFNNILTREAYRLTGGCLIVARDPLKVAYEYVSPMVRRYGLEVLRGKDLDVEDVEDYAWDLLAKEVNKAPLVYQEKRISQERIRATEEDADRGGSSRSFRHGKREEGEVESVISWGFPQSLQINSPAHQTLYRPQATFNREDYVPLVSYDDLPSSSAINNELLVLLAMGIGIYDENLPSSYIEAVIGLSSMGKLSFIFSNLDISYGVTIPLNRLIIADDEVVNEGSTATMIQLLGRIGRMGRTAIIYTRGENLEKKFNDVLRGKKDETEKMNILHSIM